MIRKIYHGGERIVRHPSFGIGRPYNDFGLGYYCTEYPQYAAEWAVTSGSGYAGSGPSGAGYAGSCSGYTGSGSNGFVSEYSIDYDGLRIINLCSSQYTPLHWLGLLFSYREFDLSSDSAYRAGEYISKYFPVDHQACDCIIGYRADNRCFMFAQNFLDAKLSYQSFRNALTSDESNRQFVLKSNRAFDRITFTGYRPAFSEDYFPSSRSRELKAMKNIKPSIGSGDIFITTLIEEEVRPYDARIR